MKKTIIQFMLICTFLIQGCTPSMNLSVKYSNVDTSESDLQLHFKFERKTKPLDLRRVWIYKDDLLVIDMEKSEFMNDIQSTWDFPTIPKGFKITFPEYLNAMPPFRKEDNLRFSFLASGSYSTYEHKPNL